MSISRLATSHRHATMTRLGLFMVSYNTGLAFHRRTCSLAVGEASSRVHWGAAKASCSRARVRGSSAQVAWRRGVQFLGRGSLRARLFAHRVKAGFRWRRGPEAAYLGKLTVVAPRVFFVRSFVYNSLKSFYLENRLVKGKIAMARLWRSCEFQAV